MKILGRIGRIGRSLSFTCIPILPFSKSMWIVRVQVVSGSIFGEDFRGIF